MTRQQVIDTIGWGLYAIVFSLLLYMCSLSTDPFSTSDDKNMKAFKSPLVSFAKSGQRFAPASELYKGTLFEGSKICISIRDEYAEQGADGQRTELRRLLPESLLAIEKIKLREATPQVIIAVQNGDGALSVTTGRASLGTERGDYLGLEWVDLAGDGSFRRSTKVRGARCVNFEEAVFIVSERDKRRYIILADVRSPSLWPYGGIMDETIATQN